MGVESPVRVEGSARAIDLELGEASQTVHPFTSASIQDVELEKVRIDVDKNGIPLRPEGHCKVITPLINVQAADQIENPALRYFVKGSSRGLDLLHNLINGTYRVVGKADDVLFQDGIDRVTQVAGIEQPLAQKTARWGERAAVATLLVGGIQYARQGNMAAALQGTRGFWKQVWPLAIALYLADSKALSHASKGFDIVDHYAQKWGKIEEGEHVFMGDSRKWARGAFYAGLLGGTAVLLNFPASKGYRSVSAPKPTPAGVKPYSWKKGLGWAGFFFALNTYWDNFSAQQRILPTLHDSPPWHAYWPGNWEWDYFQGHTAVSESVAWGLFGYVWGSLPGWQTTWADRSMKFLTGTVPSLVTRKKVKGWGSEVLPIAKGSRADQFIQRGRSAFTRGARAVGARLFTPRRFAFTGLSALEGLPLGIAIGSLMYKSQDYESKEAVSGTPVRAVITGPLSTAGSTFFAATNGVAYAWQSYLFNMIPVNYSWSACSKQGENLYQTARMLADDYETSESPDEKRHLATLLFNLHRIAYDNGSAAVAENEKLRIGELLAGVGIDAEAVEQAAIQYAAHAPEME
ncbi:MAG: hypothetical protein HY609_02775 [Deltaproteobacteria bacterium]|nr:hypothetical protein [Deltaproteobacteria bacterium]MBI4223833.1 hypothetical protein [Deltaproteobacteria bacterium]